MLGAQSIHLLIYLPFEWHIFSLTLTDCSIIWFLGMASKPLHSKLTLCSRIALFIQFIENKSIQNQSHKYWFIFCSVVNNGKRSNIKVS